MKLTINNKCKYWKTCSYYREDSAVCNIGEPDMDYCGIYERFEKNEKH